MPNNPTQDIYNPDGIGSEFEEQYFNEINNPDNADQSLYRKENDNQALDVKTRIMHDINLRTKVYVKI